MYLFVLKVVVRLSFMFLSFIAFSIFSYIVKLLENQQTFYLANWNLVRRHVCLSFDPFIKRLMPLICFTNKIFDFIVKIPLTKSIVYSGYFEMNTFIFSFSRQRYVYGGKQNYKYHFVQTNGKSEKKRLLPG